MSILLDTKKPNFQRKYWFSFHICVIMILYYKMQAMLLQNPIALFLQNVTKLYHKMCQVFYYKMLQFYYKMRQLLQNAPVQTSSLDKF